MKSNVNKKKVTIVQSENKKPPILVRNKDQQREISHEQEEMMYLQGQPHIETTTSDKEVNFPTIEEPLKTETRQMKIFKPRENYLKEKINTLNYDRQLLTNIQKDLGSQVDNIKTQIQKETVLISDVPKDLNKFIIRSTSSDNSIIKYSNEDYELKKRHKIIKDLKDEQQNLKKKLMKIEENEALLNNEGFMKLTKSADGITQFDKSIKEQHIKTIKAKKNEINERLKEIENRI